MYDFRIEIDVEPVKGFSYPKITYGITGINLIECTIDVPTTITYTHRLPAGDYSFELSMINKHRNDPTMAVDIKSIRVMEIEAYKFIYNSVYSPEGREVLHAHNYICWPGKWEMKFSSPIYTWIHKQLDLGWIYE